ncbi:type I phosphomannose isomerase catalytic subunit [Calditerricola satsumensis]|uniref:Mannose-6-phosphate isomerase n=2 Tax=Calditerricola satsumensis TaxID=373054 RepID=A0A8J3BE10_9BACI|nr:type I phosphomannose isomerase catalytic subunit [Calditerricola satsumensis]GGK07855.1 mannose-6-phosphate isomerase [Calditerricola satsumensis]
MNPYPLLLEPTFHERIWGGTALADLFGYALPSPLIGECWAVSAHPNGPSVVKNGPLAGKTLLDVWAAYRSWFGPLAADRFPLLVKLIDANDDLSVQVHPDDAYARAHEGGEPGKSECWLILKAAPGASLVYGHTATTREELAAHIQRGEWDRLLTRVPVKPGDFLYVPSGTVHAIGKGIVLLEVQQNSDVTYRLYDYDRRDASGRPRPLHVDKALDVVTVPACVPVVAPAVRHCPGATVTRYVRTRHFAVERWTVHGTAALDAVRTAFAALSLLDGACLVRWRGGELLLRKGDHALVPVLEGGAELVGRADVVVAYPGKAEEAALEAAAGRAPD